MKTKLKNISWMEKYRPNTVKDIIGDFKEQIQNYLKEPQSIPNFLFYSRSPGTGKCISKNSIFFTNNGMTSFEDYCDTNNITEEYTLLKENVYDVEEKQFKQSAYIYKSKDDTIKIKTENGYTIEGTKQHKIKVFNTKEGIIWKELQHINVDEDNIPIFYNTNIFGNNDILDYTEYNKLDHTTNQNNIIDIKLPVKINTDIGFLIGVFVANGTIDGNNVTISSKKQHIHDRIIKILKENFSYNGSSNIDNMYIGSGGKKIRDFLIHVIKCKDTTAHYKIVPKKILETSREIQLSFLEGLMEDSWLSGEKYLEYYTSSKQLAHEVKYMLLNLGFFTSHKISYLPKYEHYYHTLVMSVEHTKNFLKEFNFIYDNKKIVYNKINNTNKMSYGSKIRFFIQNKRIEYNARYKPRKHNENYVRLPDLGLMTGSIQRIKSNIHTFLEESYLKDLKLFESHNIFLDSIIEIKENKDVDIYDFHIPHTHKFLANGIINHNTTLMKAIVNDLGCDYLLLNSSDDRKIEVVREKIKDFARMKSSNGIRKCVCLDETDGMLKASQEAMRNLMETYSSNCFFILTCNNIDKIHDAIRSRCVTIEFTKPDKDDIETFLDTICNNEELTFDGDALAKLIDIHYPSIRNMINQLQDLKIQNKEVIPENIKQFGQEYYDLWEQIKQKKFREVSTYVRENGVDCLLLNRFIFWEIQKDFTGAQMIKLVQISGRAEIDMKGADTTIVFVDMLARMLAVL